MEEYYNSALELILKAGDSKSKSMMAMRAARESRFDDVERLIKEAEEEMTAAHLIQTGFLQKEAQTGELLPVTLIMVHAQDHLNNAMMTLDIAKEINNLYKLHHNK